VSAAVDVLLPSTSRFLFTVYVFLPNFRDKSILVIGSENLEQVRDPPQILPRLLIITSSVSNTRFTWIICSITPDPLCD